MPTLTIENKSQAHITTCILAQDQCCQECGKEPFFFHTTDAFYLKITEQVVCKSCGFKDFPKKFTLQ